MSFLSLIAGLVHLVSAYGQAKYVLRGAHGKVPGHTSHSALIHHTTTRARARVYNVSPPTSMPWLEDLTAWPLLSWRGKKNTSIMGMAPHSMSRASVITRVSLRNLASYIPTCVYLCNLASYSDMPVSLCVAAQGPGWCGG